MWATAEQKKPGPDDKLLLHFAATGRGGVEIGVGTLNEKYRDKKWAQFVAIRFLPTLIMSSFTQYYVMMSVIIRNVGVDIDVDVDVDVEVGVDAVLW